MSSVYKEKIGNFKIKIKEDVTPQNPRKEWDNCGIMACAHGRYELGDKQFRTPEEIDYELSANDAAVTLPLYLYDHSGITMSTTPFSCPWDSGQVGFIYMNKEKILKETGGKNLTKKRKEQALKWLKGEVETYDSYLRGAVYGFVIEEKKDDEWIEIDACWGFYGNYEEGALKEARDIVKSLMKTETEVV